MEMKMKKRNLPSNRFVTSLSTLVWIACYYYCDIATTTTCLAFSTFLGSSIPPHHSTLVIHHKSTNSRSKHNDHHISIGTSTTTRIFAATPTRTSTSSYSKKKRLQQSIIATKRLSYLERKGGGKQKERGQGNHATMLHNLSKQKTKESAMIAYDILTSLEKEETGKSSTKSLNVVHYASVINAFANIGDATFAAKILNDMIEKSKSAINSDINNTNDILFPNAHCFTGVMKAYIKHHNNIDGQRHQRRSKFSGTRRNDRYRNQHNKMNKQMVKKDKDFSLSAKCEEILEQMVALHTFVDTCSRSSSDQDEKLEEAGDALKPNTFCYNMLLKAYMEEAASFVGSKNDQRSQRPGRFQSIQNPIQHRNMSKRNEDSIQEIKLLVDKAIDVLSQMEKSTSTSTLTRTLISPVAKEKAVNDNVKLNYDQMYQQDQRAPDSYSYCTVITLLAKYCAANSKKGDSIKAAELAESYLEKVDPEYDTPSYNAVMLAWSNIGTRYGAERATLLLEKLEEGLQATSTNISQTNVGPNCSSYNTCIFAWVKSYSYGDGGYAANKAEEILAKMENPSKAATKVTTLCQPNVISYSSIIDCWSRSGSLNGAMKAQDLLDTMEHLYLSGVNRYLKPNVITYTSVLTAYARTHTVEGARRAQTLLDHMKDLYVETKDENIKPNIISYFAVIDGFARSNSTKAGIKAESILTELERLYLGGDTSMRPDVRMYARVIAAHVKNKHPKGFASAEKIVRRMERCSTTSCNSSALAKPNVVIYNTLINEYARRRQSRHALRILNQMDTYNSSIQAEKDKVRADEHTLNGIIYALSISNEVGKARKSLKILERLEGSHINGAWDVKPSTRSYNLVINACANSFRGDDNEKSEAFDIAIKVFNKLAASSYADVDRFTFISLLKACGKLLPPKSEQRQKCVLGIFHSCCDEGLVDDDILYNFLLASSSQKLPESILSYVENIGKSKVTASMLPEQWTYRATRTVHR